VNRILAQVRFVFPFRMGIDDATFIFDFEGSRTWFRVWSGLASREITFVPASERKGGVVRKHYRTMGVLHDDSKQHVRTVVTAEAEDRFLEAVTDTVGFTRFDVAFEVTADMPLSDEDVRQLTSHALACVQHFVHEYRLFRYEPDVFSPVLNDSYAELVAYSTGEPEAWVLADLSACPYSYDEAEHGDNSYYARCNVMSLLKPLDRAPQQDATRHRENDHANALLEFRRVQAGLRYLFL
jgi:hypothetical protein